MDNFNFRYFHLHVHQVLMEAHGIVFNSILIIFSINGNVLYLTFPASNKVKFSFLCTSEGLYYIMTLVFYLSVRPSDRELATLLVATPPAFWFNVLETFMGYQAWYLVVGQDWGSFNSYTSSYCWMIKLYEPVEIAVKPFIIMTSKLKWKRHCWW